MTQGQASSSPRLCRQCGATVPENATICPRCGKKWYLDKIEEQGTDLWRKIMQKRAAAGLGYAPQSQEQHQYRCPNCMAVLEAPLPVCPHCGKSTARAKIIPAEEEVPIQDVTTKMATELPDAVKGLATIKGATKRAGKLRAHKRPKTLNVIIIAVIILTLVVMGLIVARQYGWLSLQFPFLKTAEQVEPTQPIAITITDISARMESPNEVVITWATGMPASCKVMYGKTANYGMLAQTDGTPATQSITLSNLEPATRYYFIIIAVDNTGKEIARSQNYSFSTAEYNATLPQTLPCLPCDVLADATTAEEKDTKPPSISQHKVISTDTGAIIQWVTDEPATSQALYGTNESCDLSTDVDARQVTTHTVRLTGLNPNTTYYYRIKSVDPAGNEAVTDPPDSFTTLITVPMGSKVGDRAPDFTLPIFKSQDSVALKDYKGQKVLITFWAVHCPDCDRELSLMQSLKNKDLPGVALLAIFLESKPDDIDKLIARFKSEGNELTVPILVDMYKTTAHLYNVEKLPTTFLIDGDGIIREIEYGSLNIDQFEKILNSL